MGRQMTVYPDTEAQRVETAWNDPRVRVASVPAHQHFRRMALRDTPVVSYALGGELVTMRWPGAVSRTPPVRGNVSTFSSRSRMRLLQALNAIDRERVDPARAVFITLTWPGDMRFVGTPKEWKKALDRFRARLTRAYGRLPFIWKLEPQKRGAPHFHLLAILPGDLLAGDGARDRLIALRHFVAFAWNECIFQPGHALLGVLTAAEWRHEQEKHVRAGTAVERLRSWGGVVWYAAKYLGKEAVFCDQETGEALAVGRCWGIVNRAELPVAIRTVRLEREAAKQTRRTLRRWAERRGDRRAARALRGRQPSVTAFLPGAVVRRVVEFFATYHDPYGGRSIEIEAAVIARRSLGYVPREMKCSRPTDALHRRCLGDFI